MIKSYFHLRPELLPSQGRMALTWRDIMRQGRTKPASISLSLKSIFKQTDTKPMINKVILIGNLGKDPEMRYLEGNVAVAKFSVATNENYRDKNGEWQTNTEWHDVVAWRGLAERAEKQLHKGSQVFVEGKLTHRKYQDKEGNDRYTTEVVANVLRSLDKRETRSEGDFHQGDDSSATSEKSESSGQQQADDDLPF